MGGRSDNPRVRGSHYESDHKGFYVTLAAWLVYGLGVIRRGIRHESLGGHKECGVVILLMFFLFFHEVDIRSTILAVSSGYLVHYHP